MPKKVDKYENERKEVLVKLFNILGINDNNNTFLLHELDENKEKQEAILSLEPEIKKYFFCGKWSCFKDPDIKRKYLSLAKNVIKELGYLAMSARRNIKINDETNNVVVYHIAKNNL